MIHGFQVFSTKLSLDFSSIQDDPEPDPTSKADLQTALNQESSRAVGGSWWSGLGGCGRHEILGKHMKTLRPLWPWLWDPMKKAGQLSV